MGRLIRDRSRPLGEWTLPKGKSKLIGGKEYTFLTWMGPWTANDLEHARALAKKQYPRKSVHVTEQRRGLSRGYPNVRYLVYMEKSDQAKYFRR